MTLVVLNILLAVLAVVLAFVLGGKAERQGAAIVICMFAISIFGELFLTRKFASVDPAAFAQDLLAFSCFSAIAIFSTRIWPLWAAAFQMLSLSSHFVRHLEIPVRPIVYAWMKTGPTWAVYILLIVGTLAHYRRMRSRGKETSSLD